MKDQVTFYSRGEEQVETIGTITLVKGKLVAEPNDAVALQNVLDSPIRVFNEKDPLKAPMLMTAEADPEGFLKALPTTYRGSRFWAVATQSESVDA